MYSVAIGLVRRNIRFRDEEVISTYHLRKMSNWVVWGGKKDKLIQKPAIKRLNSSILFIHLLLADVVIVITAYHPSHPVHL